MSQVSALASKKKSKKRRKGKGGKGTESVSENGSCVDKVPEVTYGRKDQLEITQARPIGEFTGFCWLEKPSQSEG